MTDTPTPLASAPETVPTQWEFCHPYTLVNKFDTTIPHCLLMDHGVPTASFAVRSWGSEQACIEAAWQHAYGDGDDLAAEVIALRAEVATLTASEEGARMILATVIGEREAARAEVATLRASEARMREAVAEAVEVVHKAYVAATMEAVNAGPSHPIAKNFDAWRVRCMNAETKGRAALQGETK